MVVNNPNNWHWVDKNCIDWARNYFNENLLKVEVSDPEVRISKVSSLEGDVEVSQRKGKVISLFDLKLALEFKSFEEGVEVNSGTITIPELAYDSEADDLQFAITLFQDKDADALRTHVKTKLIPILKKALLKFGPDLIATNSSDIQLSSDKVNSTFTKANQEASVASVKKVQENSKATVKAPAKKEEATSYSNTPKYNTSTLHLEPVFNTTAEQLYVTLLDPSRVVAWSRSMPIMKLFPQSEGNEYQLFGGSVTGSYLELETNERILQTWRLSDWKSGHFAKMDIRFIQGAGETKVVVDISGIPVGEEDRVRNNFEEYYIKSIKITFGFGAVL